MSDLVEYCADLGRRARLMAGALATMPTQHKDRALRSAAASLQDRADEILAANQRDLADAEANGLTNAQIDRLRLTPKRIQAAADGLWQVAALPDPVGRLIEGGVRPSGIRVTKVGVPLGVILFLYESRPNVTVDAAALAFKSGNALILRGGKEARHSNAALFRALTAPNCIGEGAIQLVDTPDRTVVGHLLKLREYIDLVIPRGGEGLIERVSREATMPVLKHYRGNCHVYVDESADLVMAARILVDAKCSRPGVCNAAESLLVHQQVAKQFLPAAVEMMRQYGHEVEIRGCERTRTIIPAAKPVTDEDYAAEFLDLVLSVKVVDSLDDAMMHIQRYGSGHTEAIITTDIRAADKFVANVDSSAVMVNASTRFNDGFELGLGAEIGISTDKLHARGPCGLRELTSYKYVIHGDGHVRE